MPLGPRWRSGSRLPTSSSVSGSHLGLAARELSLEGREGV